jgi:hypothetical protein
MEIFPLNDDWLTTTHDRNCYPWKLHFGLPVKLLLGFDSTVIPDFIYPRDPQPRFLFSPKYVRVQKSGLLFNEGGEVDLSVQALHLLYRSFSTGISALSRRPSQWWELCSLCHYSTLSNIYTVYVYRGFLSMQACAAGHDLTYLIITETSISQLIAHRLDRRQV